ncbi:MAG TPA: hypothetical protein VFZ01_19285 [Geminicoccaceae bacterium]
MPIDSSYVLMVSMDVAADKEDLFNEVYDQEHIPNLLKVPGVLSATRARSEPFRMSIGGDTKEVEAASPRYVAIYEIERPEVLAGAAWAEAVEAGRWPTEVRPHTTNRRQALFRKR